MTLRRSWPRSISKEESKSVKYYQNYLSFKIVSERRMETRRTELRCGRRTSMRSRRMSRSKLTLWRIWITANLLITEEERLEGTTSLCLSTDSKKTLRILWELPRKLWRSILRRPRVQKSITIKTGQFWGKPSRMKQLKFSPWWTRIKMLINLLWWLNSWTWESLYKGKSSILTCIEN